MFILEPTGSLFFKAIQTFLYSRDENPVFPDYAFNNITANILFYQDENGDTLLHFLLRHYSQLNKEKVRSLIENLLLASNQLAKMDRNLNSSPTRFLLECKNNEGKTAMEMAVVKNDLVSKNTIEEAGEIALAEEVMQEINYLVKFFVKLGFEVDSEALEEGYGKSATALSCFSHMHPFSLLQRLANAQLSIEYFIDALQIYERCFYQDWLPKESFLNLLAGNNPQEDGLLHGLLERVQAVQHEPGALELEKQGLISYLMTVERLYKAQILAAEDYKLILLHKNSIDKTVVQKVINNQCLELTCTFIDWLKDDCSLSHSDKHSLLTKSKLSNSRVSIPTRNHKLCGARLVNDNLRVLKNSFTVSPSKKSSPQNYLYCQELLKKLPSPATTHSYSSTNTRHSPSYFSCSSSPKEVKGKVSTLEHGPSTGNGR